MNSPLISVIIPVYNTKKHLSKCIDSVVGQSYSNLEIIIINDGSTDGSGVVIDEYSKLDARIKAVHMDNSGVSSARNCGLGIANGDYVTFVDSDDFIEKDTYIEVAQAICVGDKDFVVFSMRVVDERGRVLSASEDSDGVVAEMSTNEAIIIDYLDSSDLSACNYVFKSSLIKKHKFDENMRINEDALFVFRILLESSGGVRIKRIFYNYLHNQKSATKSFKMSDIEDRRRYISFVIDSIAKTYPSLLLAAKTRVFKNQDLIGLLLNSKILSRNDTVRSTRRDMRDFLNDLQGVYSMPISDRFFIAMTYLPNAIFVIAYGLYHRLKEAIR